MKHSLRLASAAAAAGHGVLVVLWLTSVPASIVLLAWLATALFILGIGSGAQAIHCIHGLTGGRWIEALEPGLGALARLAPLATLPLLALLAAATLLFPFLFPLLFPWAGELPPETAHVVREKEPWLNLPFFVVRTLAFAAVTLLLAFWCNARMSASRSAIGLILWLPAVSLLAIDWLMSLAPEWFSTMIGLWLGASFVLSALAATALTAATGRRQVDPGRRNDVAVLLLAAVLFWFYVSFMQYLIIWSANLPEEIGWFVARRTPYWEGIAVLMSVLIFAVPLATLVFAPVRRSPALLATIAGSVLLGRLLESHWQIQPAASASATVHALASAAALVGLGGLGVAALSLFDPGAGDR